MFNWFHRKEPTAPAVDVLELLEITFSKASLSDMAIEKAVGMISKAIAKSEFKVWKNGKAVKNNTYWTLNVQPNANESATEFWKTAIRKLLINGECVIVPLGGSLYIASGYDTTNTVTLGKIYTNVNISSGGNEMSLNRNFSADELIIIRHGDKKIQTLLRNNLKMYDEVASALIASKKTEAIPKFSLNVESAVPIIRTKDENGNDVELNIDQYKEKIRALLESESISIITNQQGMRLEKLDVGGNVTSEDIVKMAREIFTETAYAFDIPKAVFLGEITEKADSTNEFITYAVDWIVEIVNDALAIALVGKESFLKGREKITIDMTKYKHVDLVENAVNLDKLRAMGFNFDEIREIVGYEELGDEFGQKRLVTKNYAEMEKNENG